MSIESDYTLIKFERSKDSKKKYVAIVRNNKTLRTKRIPFGTRGHLHYKDVTGLRLYSHNDHLDDDRRKRYRDKYKEDGLSNRAFKSSWFSYHFLW